jgi:hypothetical protein
MKLLLQSHKAGRDSMSSAGQGGCQCGAVRYEITGQPVKIYICHCTECRHQSASAFGISVIVDSADLVLKHGKPKKWTRKADIGGALDCYFCPECGSRLWHGNPHADSTISIKGGSLDQPPDLTAVSHIWTSSKLQGIQIAADSPTFPGEPD